MGEYVCPRSTVFGLKREEIKTLIDNGIQVFDHQPDIEGQEVNTSGFNVSFLNEKEILM